MKLFILSLFLLCQPAHSQWMDSGSEVFYSPQTSQVLFQYKSFPTGWWNFIFFKPGEMSREEICTKLNSQATVPFNFNSCNALPIPKNWVKDWVNDFPLRYPPISTQRINTQLNKTLARLNLPLPPELFEQIRLDPMSAGEAFVHIFQQFYAHPDEEVGDWQWIALQMNYSHEDVTKTSALMKPLKDPRLRFVGPHFAGVENQERVILDLQNILAVGVVLLLAIAGFLLWSGRWIFILAIPILLSSIGLAALCVVFIWGSIHGLTLAFGSALIGISLDYAFHGLMDKHQNFVWKTNALSFFTSFVAFLLLCLFDIPLIQQMGLFAALGLSFSFILFYTLSRHLPKGLHAKPLLKRKIPSHLGFAIALFIIFELGLKLGFIFVEQDYSLKNFDYSLVNKNKIVHKMTPITNKTNYALLFEDGSDWSNNYKNPAWAQQNNIPHIGVLSFSSSPQLERRNLKKWIKWSCNEVHLRWKYRLAPETRSLFKEFFDMIECQNLKNRLDNYTEDRSYTLPFKSKNKNLFIMQAVTEEHRQLIANKYPQAFYLKDKISEFPDHIKKQIFNILGIILVLCFVILVIAFRLWSLLAILPIIGGAGLSFSYHWISGTTMTFMSFIGLIILLGLTLDYGIFTTSRIVKKKSLEDVWGPLILSGMTSLIGFTPLIFCKHPALHDVGITLFTGILGALTTSFFILPAFAQCCRKFREKNNV